MTFSTDFTLFDHGSTTRLVAHTDAAKGWVDDHLPSDALFFGNGTVIEPRYVGPIIDGIEGDGLSVLGVMA